MDDYWEHTRHGNEYMYKNNERVVTKGTHATDLFSDWAIADIKQAKDDSRPFFQFLSYNAPHDPIHPPKDYYERFKKRNPKSTETRALLGGLIEHMDYSIGRVLDSLEKLGLAKNTLIILLQIMAVSSALVQIMVNSAPIRLTCTRVVCAFVLQ